MSKTTEAAAAVPDGIPPGVIMRYTKGWMQRSESRRSVASLSVIQRHADIKAQCRKEKRLFEDPSFPANNSSLYFKNPPAHPLVWKRPGEICQKTKMKPDFMRKGVSRFDVDQGELGDCWLVAAVSCLSQFPDLLQNVVPPDQNFADDYCGIFRFRFWTNGEWTEIVVDDRLPTYQDKLVYMQSTVVNEFWSSLLEKAYAKLNGSYEALVSGKTSEAMEDFTGGVTEIYILNDAHKKPPANLFEIMQQAHDKESLMGCSITGKPGECEEPLPNGLLKGHAYGITGIKIVSIETSKGRGPVRLVRIRNPWGNDKEWNGPWSDNSPEWNFVSQAQREQLHLVKRHDGEFWMSFKDFMEQFDTLEMCNLGATVSPDDPPNAMLNRRWSQCVLPGSWIPRVNAGGWRKNSDTFWTNPKYFFEIVEPDEGDLDKKGTVLIALLQCGRRKMVKDGQGMLQIGYSIYQAKNGTEVDRKFFHNNAPVADCVFTNRREVMGRHKLVVGRYILVPSTVNPGCQADFLVRIYTEKPVKSKEVNETTSFKNIAPVPISNGGHALKSISEADEIIVPKPATIVVKSTPDDNKAEEVLQAAFREIAGDDQEIDAYDLQEVLNNVFMKEFKFDGFNIETCKSLVSMKDVDRSGKLGYPEFKKLWADLRVWKTVFKKEDRDHNGTFDSFELRETLRTIGATISNQTFNALVQRYCHKDGKMYFDDYIHCIARLTTMFEIFGEMSRGKPKAEFELDQFIQTTMYS